MKRVLFIMLLAMLQLACSRQDDQAKASLEGQLTTEKNLVKYGDFDKYPGGVICGEYSEFDPRTGRTKPRPFVFQAGSSRPASADEQAIFCSKDQSQALYTQLGIGPFGQEGTYLPRIQADLHKIRSAIETYRTLTSAIPPMGNDLIELTTDSGADGPILAAVPLDPWDRPYVYDSNQLGFGSKRTYKLYTLGADGHRGGRGENADVGLEHLKYLDHLVMLQQ